jgi:hypothetical protein
LNENRGKSSDAPEQLSCEGSCNELSEFKDEDLRHKKC